MAARYFVAAQVCDQNGGNCSFHWVDWETLPFPNGILPPLSIADAQLIGQSIVLLLAVVFGYRVISRFINRS